MDRQKFKLLVEKQTGRRDVIAYVAETLGISNSGAALKVRGESEFTLAQALSLKTALAMSNSAFMEIFMHKG